MTSLVEAQEMFGPAVRDAGGVIFGIEWAPLGGSGREERIQIGTPDGFVKIAVYLNQPDINTVLWERTASLVRHAGELRSPARLALAGSSISEPEAPPRRR